MGTRVKGTPEALRQRLTEYLASEGLVFLSGRHQRRMQVMIAEEMYAHGKRSRAAERERRAS